jgi:hypothetical protein
MMKVKELKIITETANSERDDHGGNDSGFPST